MPPSDDDIVCEYCLEPPETCDCDVEMATAGHRWQPYAEAAKRKPARRAKYPAVAEMRKTGER